MNLIAYEPHFWELYRDDDRYYLSLAIDMSSVVSCWDLALTQEEIQGYEHRNHASIQELAKSLVALAYKGDFSQMERCAVKPYERQAMQQAFKNWQKRKNAS